MPGTAAVPSQDRTGGGSSHAEGTSELLELEPELEPELERELELDREPDREPDPGPPVRRADPRRRRRQARSRFRTVERGPWLIAGLFLVLYSVISVMRYERRESMSWDLAIFTQAIRQYAHFHAPIVDIRGNGLDLLGDHFHPILILLAPFFRAFPTPVTLLVAQSFLFAVAAVPITRTAMDLVGRRQAYAVGLAYGLSWGIVQAVNFDFHELAFAVPLLAWSLCAYVRKEGAKAFLWALPLLFVKEDIAPLTCVIIGMVLAERYKDRPVLRGLSLGGGMAAGIGVFFLLIDIVIPHFNPQHVYLYWNNGGCVDPKLGNTVGKLISCATGQELNGLGVKDRTLLLTLLPTAFLALRSPIVLLSVPGILMKFLNTNNSYWGTDYHYSAVPMVICFVAAVDGLNRIQLSRASGRRTPVPPDSAFWSWLSSRSRMVGDYQLRYGAVAMLAVGLALSQEFPLQDLWQSSTYTVSDRAHALKRAEAVVPDDVSVETTISMLASLAARTHTYWMGYPNPVAPEYVVFDLSQQDWNGAPTALAFVEQRHPGYIYTQVYKDPKLDVYVFKQSSFGSS